MSCTQYVFGRKTMANKVTINDIAANLGLSRNTVSRVLNGSEGISNETRLKVLEEATRVNYKMLGTRVAAEEKKPEAKVILVTKDIQLVSGTIFNFMMFSLQPMIKARHASLDIRFMSDAEVNSGKLPPQTGEADAIIIFEILNEEYIQLLMNTGKPCIMFDCPVDPNIFRGKFDVVMEDGTAISQLVREETDRGVRKFGFVGDPTHCLGYRGRYNAFRNTIDEYPDAEHLAYDVIDPEYPGMNFKKVFTQKLRKMELPEVFVCANHFLAQTMVSAAKKLSIATPEKLRIYSFGLRTYFGYGNDKKSEDHRHVEDLASTMVMLVFDRLRYPDVGRRVVRLQAQVHLVTKQSDV